MIKYLKLIFFAFKLTQNLRERRKKYKRNSSMLTNLMNLQHQNSNPTVDSSVPLLKQPIIVENSSSSPLNPDNQPSPSSSVQKSTEKLSKQPTIDRSKLRMRDFLYYNPPTPPTKYIKKLTN